MLSRTSSNSLGIEKASATVLPSPEITSESASCCMPGLVPAYIFANARNPPIRSRRFFAVASSFASALNVPLTPPLM